MTFNLDGNGPTPWTAELRQAQQSSAPDTLVPKRQHEGLMAEASEIALLGGLSVLAVYEGLLTSGDSDDVAEDAA